MKDEFLDRDEMEALDNLACLKILHDINVPSSLVKPLFHLFRKINNCKICSEKLQDYEIFRLIDLTNKKITRKSAISCKTISCTIDKCKFQTTSSFNLKDHLKKIHHENLMFYECPNEGCVKKYRNVNGLKYHLNNHH